MREIAVGILGADAVKRRVIIAPWDALPRKIREEAAKQDARPGDIRGVYWRGKTYLVSGAFPGAKEVAAVLYHEYYAHFGLRAKYGRELGNPLAVLLGKVGGLEGVLKLAKEQGIDLSEYETGVLGNKQIARRDQRLILMEELMAHVSETTGTLRRTIEEWVGLVRAFLRRHGFAELADFGVTDLAAELRGAREAAIEATAAPDKGKPSFQRVFHGSPYSGIEQTGFKLNKIGTGEGAQAYGWGIYFAGKREVAGGYRKAAVRKLRGEAVQLRHELENNVRSEKPNALERFDLFEYARMMGPKDGWSTYIADHESSGTSVPEGMKSWFDKNVAPLFGEGQLYHAEIPEDKDLLDWDKPLSEQPEAVREALRNAGVDVRWRMRDESGRVIGSAHGTTPEDAVARWNRAARDPEYRHDTEVPLAASAVESESGANGKAIYDNLVASRGSPRDASEYLNSIGIPGLRYLDGGSRSAGEGTHNYVIWDENLLTPEKADITPYYSRRRGDDGSDAEVSHVMAQYAAHPNAPSEAEVRAAERDYRDTERAYGGREAFDKAKATGKTKLNYTQWVQVRTQHFRRWFGDWQSVRAQERLDAMRPINVRVPAKWRGLSHVELRQRMASALDRMVRERVEIHHPELGTIRVGRTGASKSKATARDPAKSLVTADIEALIPQAIYARSEPSRGKDGPDISGYSTLLARVEADGVQLVAVFTVRHQSDGKWYYNSVTLHDAQKEARDSYGQPDRGTGSSDAPIAGLADFVRRPLTRVNPDTVSKVTDLETGEPLPLYHATNADIEAFDPDKTQDSLFWLTSDPDATDDSGAAGRNAVMQVFLNARKPAGWEQEDRLTVDQMIQEGYDSLHLDDNYAAFEPNQIKSATANIGTFSDRGEVMFSRRRDAATGDLFGAASPARQERQQERRADTGDLFGGPSTRDFLGAAERAKDDLRNGRVGGREDRGDGGLFDGQRPEQMRVPDGGQDARTSQTGDVRRTQTVRVGGSPVEVAMFPDEHRGTFNVSWRFGRTGDSVVTPLRVRRYATLGEASAAYDVLLDGLRDTGKVPDDLVRHGASSGSDRFRDMPPADQHDTSTTALAGATSAIESARAGKGSVAALRAAFRRVRENEATVMSELAGHSRVQLQHLYGLRMDTKDAMVRMAYDALLQRLALGKPISFSITGSNPNAFADAAGRTIDGLTDQDLADYAAKVANARDVRDAAVAGMKNPQTLDDFRRLTRALGGEAKLTVEQREKYDRLRVEARAEQRAKDKERANVVRAVDTGDTGMTLVETKHTRDGHDLFVVQMDQRVDRDTYTALNARAKQLGGYYSSYRGRGAVPGFTFRTRNAAEKFMALREGDQSSGPEQASRDAQKREARAETLSDKAATLRASATEALERDRQTNTVRRARQAQGAEAEARAQLALADTMDRIAAAQTEGTAGLLDEVRYRNQVELLESTLKQAAWDHLRAEGVDWEEASSKPIDNAQLADATLPQFGVTRETLAEIARKLWHVHGGRQLSRSLAAKLNYGDAYENAVREAPNKLLYRTSDGGRAVFKTKRDAQAALDRMHRFASAAEQPAGQVVRLGAGQWGAALDADYAITRGLWRAPSGIVATLSVDTARKVQKLLGENQRESGLPWWWADRLAQRAQFERMGITYNFELREALRQYAALRKPPAEENRVSKLERALVGKKVGVDFFPTPPAVAQRVVDAADIGPNMRVLEPSAGKGDLADAVRAAEPNAEIDAIEMAPDLRELLEAKGYDLVGSDFTDFNGDGAAYDRIVMNPPFGNGADGEHVRRAFDLLKPGGRLVAIMSEGTFSRSDKKATGFREWLDSVNGSSEKLPEGSFRSSFVPTGVNTRLVVIDKPEVGQSANRAPPAMLHSVLPESGKPARGGLNVAQTEKAIARILVGARAGLDRNGVEVRVVPNMGAFGDAAEGRNFAGGYDPVSNRIYIVASNTVSAAAARRTLLHEMVGHFGLNLFEPKVKADILAAIERTRPTRQARKSTAWRELWSNIESNYADRSAVEQAEEVFARIAERPTGPLRAWLDRVLTRYLLPYLRRVGLAPQTVTLAELRALASDIAKGIHAGAVQRTRDDELMEQRVFHGSEAEVAHIMAQYAEHPNAPSEAEVRAAVKDYHDTERAYGGREAFDKAKATGKTKLNYTQWVQVRTQHFRRWFGDWQALRAQTQLDAMKPVDVHVPDDWRGLSEDAMRAKMAETLDALVRSKIIIDHPELGAVKIGRRGANKTGSTSKDPADMLVANDLEAALPQSIYARTEPSNEQGVAGYSKLLLPIRIDGKPLVAVFTVRRQADGDWYYNTVTVEDAGKGKRPGSYASLGTENRPLRQTPITGLSDFVRRPLTRVNPDTVSKVIDRKTGEPLIVYHGSPDARFMNEDAVFRTLGERYGRSEPDKRAFWFGDRATANSYADDRRAFDYQNAEPAVIAGFLKLADPLVVDGKGKEWREAQAIGKTTDVIEKARSERRDGVIIRNVKDNYNNTPRTSATDTYAVFSSNQIKSADNNIGTFSERPEISFSLPDDAGGDARTHASDVTNDMKATAMGGLQLFRQGETAKSALVAGNDPAALQERLQTVQKVVNAVKAKWGPNQPTVRVLATADELPESAKTDPRFRYARGFYDGETVYLVASVTSWMARQRPREWHASS